VKQIVVGADPRPAGRAALCWALQEAVTRGDTGVTVVRAWSPHVTRDPRSTAVQAQREAQDLVDHEVKLAADAVPGASGLDIRASAPLGEPAHALVAVVEDPELVVIGSAGRHGLRGAVTASLWAAVLRRTRSPLVVVPGTTSTGHPGRVVVGVDHSPGSLEALALAVVEARAHSAVLVPVMAHRPLDDGAGTPDLSSLEASERRALVDLAVQAGAPEDLVRAEVLVAGPEQALRQVASPDDLLVVGRARGHHLDHGSTARGLALHATCPVIVSGRPR